MGDILGILNSSGKEIAKYVYDAWGNHKIEVYGGSDFVDISSNKDYTNNSEFSNNRFIAEINPFRYRGYCFDSETKLYYLNSRYYDPEIGRFINADDIGILDTTKDVVNGLNLYAYCLNNPVNTSDECGNIPNWLKWLIGGVIIAAAVVATVVTGGAAAGTIAAAVHTIAVSALTTGAISAGIGFITGGINYSTEKGFGWDWNSASEGFFEGALTGTTSGALSGLFVGMNITTQILSNAIINGSITTIKGIIKGNIDLHEIVISAGFGAIAGGLAVTNLGVGFKGLFLSTGLQLSEIIVESVYKRLKHVISIII